MYWIRLSTAVLNTASLGKRVVHHTPLRRGRFTKLCLRTFRNTQRKPVCQAVRGFDKGTDNGKAFPNAVGTI